MSATVTFGTQLTKCALRLQLGSGADDRSWLSRRSSTRNARIFSALEDKGADDGVEGQDIKVLGLVHDIGVAYMGAVG
jgi:hypothetical protein